MRPDALFLNVDIGRSHKKILLRISTDPTYAIYTEEDQS